MSARGVSLCRLPSRGTGLSHLGEASVRSRARWADCQRPRPWRLLGCGGQSWTCCLRPSESLPAVLTVALVSGRQAVVSSGSSLRLAGTRPCWTRGGVGAQAVSGTLPTTCGWRRQTSRGWPTARPLGRRGPAATRTWWFSSAWSWSCPRCSFNLVIRMRRLRVSVCSACKLAHSHLTIISRTTEPIRKAVLIDV